MITRLGPEAKKEISGKTSITARYHSTTYVNTMTDDVRKTQKKVKLVHSLGHEFSSHTQEPFSLDGILGLNCFGTDILQFLDDLIKFHSVQIGTGKFDIILPTKIIAHPYNELYERILKEMGKVKCHMFILEKEQINKLIDQLEEKKHMVNVKETKQLDKSKKSFLNLYEGKNILNKYKKDRKTNQKTNCKLLYHCKKTDMTNEIFVGWSYDQKLKSLKALSDSMSYQGIFIYYDNPNYLDAIEYVRSMVLSLLSIDPELEFPIIDWFGPFEKLFRLSRLEFASVAKYCTAYPLAVYLKNDPPPKPKSFGVDCPLLFTGRLRKWLKRHLLQQNTKKGHLLCLKLWFTYLQSVKRACKPLSQEYIKSSYEKHADILSVQKAYNPELMYKFQKSAKVFAKDFHPSKPKLFSPSLSASFENGLMNGGSYVQVLDELISEGNVNEQNLASIQFYQMPEGILKGIRSSGEVGIDVVRDYLKEKYPYPQVKGDDNELYMKSEPNYMLKSKRDKVDFHWDPILSVETYAISEPLKVRMITKGEAMPYWMSKFFQKELWNNLKQYPQFSLTNEVLDHQHLYMMNTRSSDLLIKYQKDINGNYLDIVFDSYVSGDFSSATDNLKSAYTMSAFEALLEQYGSWRKGKESMKDLFNDIYDKYTLRSVLYNSTVKYPKWTGVKPVHQLNGQLMGCPLSFPILCMVNLLAYKLAMEEYFSAKIGKKTTFSIRELPVLINGDDILFPSNVEFYKIWLKWINEVGFELSIGKNYIHKSTLTINSRCFNYDADKFIFEEILYINNGLLIGQSKLRQTSTSKLLPLSDWYNTAMLGATPETTLLFHNKFLNYHEKRITKCTEDGNYNLFASNLLGGLGFHYRKEIPNYFTNFQKQLGHFLHNKLTTFEGTASQLKKIIFRPLSDDPILELPFLKDNTKFKTFLLEKKEIHDAEDWLENYIIETKFKFANRPKMKGITAFDLNYSGKSVDQVDLKFKSASKILDDFRLIQKNHEFKGLEDEELMKEYVLCFNNMDNLYEKGEHKYSYNIDDPEDVTEHVNRYMSFIDGEPNSDNIANIEEILYTKPLNETYLDNTLLTKELMNNVPDKIIYNTNELILINNIKIQEKLKNQKKRSVLNKKRLDLIREKNTTNNIEDDKLIQEQKLFTAKYMRSLNKLSKKLNFDYEVDIIISQ